jgi:hypothetical protein
LCDTILKVNFENATERYLCNREYFWITDTPRFKIDARVYFINPVSSYYLYYSEYIQKEGSYFAAYAHLSYYRNNQIQYEEIISTDPGNSANKRIYDAVVQLSDYIVARMEAAGFVDDCPE